MNLTQAHQEALQDILQWRHDVRHFCTDPIAPEVIEMLRAAMDYAPSVGNARPWRVVEVASEATRAKILANFTAANAKAATLYSGTRRADYNALKLAGLRDAPLQLAVFTDLAPAAGDGLGRQSMPEMLQYSTVTAIHTLWLAARAANIGVGWVSILDPQAVCDTLGVPDDWKLTGYLCIGHAESDDDTPLLDRKNWQKNAPTVWTKA